MSRNATWGDSMGERAQNVMLRNMQMEAAEADERDIDSLWDSDKSSEDDYDFDDEEEDEDDYRADGDSYLNLRIPAHPYASNSSVDDHEKHAYGRERSMHEQLARAKQKEVANQAKVAPEPEAANPEEPEAAKPEGPVAEDKANESEEPAEKAKADKSQKPKGDTLKAIKPTIAILVVACLTVFVVCGGPKAVFDAIDDIANPSPSVTTSSKSSSDTAQSSTASKAVVADKDTETESETTEDTKAAGKTSDDKSEKDSAAEEEIPRLPKLGMDAKYLDKTELGKHDGKDEVLESGRWADGTPYYWLAHNDTGDRVFGAIVRDGEVIKVTRYNEYKDYWQDGSFLGRDFPDMDAAGKRVEKKSTTKSNIPNVNDYDDPGQFADDAEDYFKQLGSSSPWKDAYAYWEKHR